MKYWYSKNLSSRKSHEEYSWSTQNTEITAEQKSFSFDIFLYNIKDQEL